MNPTSAEISQTQIRFLIEDSGAISHPFSTQDFPKMGFQIDVSRLALSNYWNSVSIQTLKERIERHENRPKPSRSCKTGQSIDDVWIETSVLWISLGFSSLSAKKIKHLFIPDACLHVLISSWWKSSPYGSPRQSAVLLLIHGTQVTDVADNLKSDFVLGRLR